MAFISSEKERLYVFVESEDMDQSIEVSTHPVEDGINITDTTKNKPITISISGVVVDFPASVAGYSKVKNSAPTWEMSETFRAATVLSHLNRMKRNGELVSYVGRNYCSNLLITSFSTSHPKEVVGGATFDMTLTECRIAKNSYVEPKQDESNVKDGGEQQVNKGDNSEVWYTVQKGDTIWWLIWRKKNGTTADYRNLKRDGADSNSWEQNRDWVINKNPNAFSRPGDDRTMQIGAKLLLGYK